VFFKTTDTHQFLHKDSVHPKHTKNYWFDEAWQIMSISLCRRNYTKRKLRHINSKHFRELQIQ
jgi:hypothetical protein